MSTTLLPLMLTAISIAFFHTAAGPDHYLPFIFLSRSRGWSLPKTILLTVVCGFGHVATSIVLGFVGVLMGWQLSKIEFLQDVRGEMSSWALLIFGLAYFVWGLWRASKDQSHKHFDIMDDDIYVFEHKHGHSSYTPNSRIKVTPLVLLVIFAMGPSEPIIPLLFFSGTHQSVFEITMVMSAFTLATIATMVTMVLLGTFSYNQLKTEGIDRFSHAIGGFVISFCASGMLFFGW